MRLSYIDCFVRCFPHVVNLACKAVLSAVTNLEFAKETAQDYIPEDIETEPVTFADSINRDPIATVRSMIWGVSGYIGTISTNTNVCFCTSLDSFVILTAPVFLGGVAESQAKRPAAFAWCGYTLVIDIAHGRASPITTRGQRLWWLTNFVYSRTHSRLLMSFLTSTKWTFWISQIHALGSGVGCTACAPEDTWSMWHERSHCSICLSLC